MPRLVNLSKMHSRRERPKDLDPWEPDESAVRILEELLEYRYLTSELLVMLYEARRGRGGSHVRHQLTRLWHHGYVERFSRRADAGSSQYVYTLSVKGARVVVPGEEWSDARHKVYNVAKPKADYEHVLATSLLKVLWYLGSPSQSDVFLTEEYWNDKESSRKETKNEFRTRVDRENVYIRPDTTVLIEHKQGDFFRPYFFEIERTHKNYDRLRERLRAYSWLLGDDGRFEVDRVFAKHTGLHPSTGFVVFIAASQAHAARLREAAQLVVGETDVTRKERPQMWFSSLDVLFRKDVLRDDLGVPIVDRHGRERWSESVIEPADFFQRELLVNLDGKPGRLVI